MWVLAIVAAFALLVWVGRQSRLGRLAAGPWIRQFRAVRSVTSLLLMAVGAFLIVHGDWPAGLACLIAVVVLSGSVRVSGMRSMAPKTAASYSAEEIRAYQVLELPIGADRAAIKAAWKRLMKSAHPDSGGSAGRAVALNAARDVLLRRR